MANTARTTNKPAAEQENSDTTTSTTASLPARYETKVADARVANRADYEAAVAAGDVGPDPKNDARYGSKEHPYSAADKAKHAQQRWDRDAATKRLIALHQADYDRLLEAERAASPWAYAKGTARTNLQAIMSAGLDEAAARAICEAQGIDPDGMAA
jgi:hypothetical protein